MRWSPCTLGVGLLRLGAFNSEAITISNLALVGIDLGKHTFHLYTQNKSGRDWERNIFRLWLKRLETERFKTSPDATYDTIVLAVQELNSYSTISISGATVRIRF
jgi:hypothetical protein